MIHVGFWLFPLRSQVSYFVVFLDLLRQLLVIHVLFSIPTLVAASFPVLPIISSKSCSSNPFKNHFIVVSVGVLRVNEASQMKRVLRGN